MLMPSDRDYKVTKSIKFGKRVLDSPYYELAQWIKFEFNAVVLNIYYDLIKPENRPRLNIVFEFENDNVKFNNDQLGGYNEEKQKIIAKKFIEILRDFRLKDKKWFGRIVERTYFGLDTKNMWVTFSSFENIAKQEVVSKISEIEMKKLKDKLNDKQIWEISNFSGFLTLFYFTEDQVIKSKETEIDKMLREEFYEIISQYDEFNYFTKEGIQINFDSKENFDKNYESNWFYYYR
jgi:hypothetical protein